MGEGLWTRDSNNFFPQNFYEMFQLSWDHENLLDTVPIFTSPGSRKRKTLSLLYNQIAKLYSRFNETYEVDEKSF